ncbi:hypothetical protein VP01_2589g3 [Puccinia sorghi]|uniref:Uncharacterized protein n=1 Tax=Puccinia sorghi TaxID=27349 RepID=A0A0L6V4T1_9BASI|nr:hypothetical protein VP01_2589g3 [Puccinia sorghi]
MLIICNPSRTLSPYSHSTKKIKTKMAIFLIVYYIYFEIIKLVYPFSSPFWMCNPPDVAPLVWRGCPSKIPGDWGSQNKSQKFNPEGCGSEINIVLEDQILKLNPQGLHVKIDSKTGQNYTKSPRTPQNPNPNHPKTHKMNPKAPKPSQPPKHYQSQLESITKKSKQSIKNSKEDNKKKVKKFSILIGCPFSAQANFHKATEDWYSETDYLIYDHPASEYPQAHVENRSLPQLSTPNNLHSFGVDSCLVMEENVECYTGALQFLHLVISKHSDQCYSINQRSRSSSEYSQPLVQLNQDFIAYVERTWIPLVPWLASKELLYWLKYLSIILFLLFFPIKCVLSLLNSSVLASSHFLQHYPKYPSNSYSASLDNPFTVINYFTEFISVEFLCPILHFLHTIEIPFDRCQ